MSVQRQGTLLGGGVSPGEVNVGSAVQPMVSAVQPADRPIDQTQAVRVARPPGKAIFGMFPLTCPACQDEGRELTMGFLDHTLRFGDPIIRACSPRVGEAAGLDAVGEPLTGSLDDLAYLFCPDFGCGRQFGPYSAREFRHRLLRSWS